MRLLLAFHIISFVAWFAALFYLPRLFVYHAEAQDITGRERFKIMEHRLYYAIAWPGALATTIFGIAIFSLNIHYYAYATWMQLKLLLVGLLWAYHLSLGHYLKKFARDKNTCSSRFFRFYNEIPTVLLIVIVLLVKLKPVWI